MFSYLKRVQFTTISMTWFFMKHKNILIKPLFLPAVSKGRSCNLNRKMWKHNLKFLIHPVHFLVRRTRKAEGRAAVFLRVLMYITTVCVCYLGKQMSVFSFLTTPASSQPTASFGSRCKKCSHNRAVPGRRKAGCLDRKLRVRFYLTKWYYYEIKQIQAINTRILTVVLPN